ncbi:hypothetical protein LCGC14_1872680 [marine sediment metagenome]|uniref:Uncharacterized protein n=1 Tax=marine sediment metagenome TaxID=412755 RepID=A0A0F9GSL3_9ZZZZ
MTKREKELREKETEVRFVQLAKMMTSKNKFYLGEKLTEDMEIFPDRPVGAKTAMVIYLG